MSNKRINKAYIRYDGTGRVIPGALLLNRFKPKGGGQWHEIPAYECCNPIPVVPALRLLFSNILEVGGIVGDVTDVAVWNTFFDLPTYGSPFTSVTVVGNEVQLFGGSNIVIKEMLFDQVDELGTYLLEVDDTLGSIIELEYDAFGRDNYSGCPNLISVNFPNVTIVGSRVFYYCTSLVSANLPQLTTTQDRTFTGCTSLTSANLPLLTIAGDACFLQCSALTSVGLPQLITAGSSSFSGCSTLTTISLPLVTTIGDTCFNDSVALTTISLPSCTDLGGSVGNNDVFFQITGNSITLTIPSALMTANAGNPDGDIVYLQANNTVTVVTV